MIVDAIQVKRGAYASIPTLLAGEFGFSTDATKKLHIGDGAANHEIVLADLFDAGTILYATSDNTPEAKTRAQFLALLSGQASAAFSMNTQKITGVVDPEDAQDVATKNYVDGVLGANDAMAYKGVIDCSANPNYPAADAGDTHKVSVAGKIGGASGPNVEVGDMLICTTDATASGDHATVGANWTIIQVNIDGAVIGPASAVDDRIATFNGTSGKLLQDGGVAISALFNKSSDDTDDITVGTTNKFVTAADITKLGNLSGTNTGDEVAASGAEVNTGTDNTKMVTALALADSNYLAAGDTIDGGTFA